MNLINFLLMAGPTDAKGGSPYSGLILIGLLFVVFYFFMIRPQVKRTKDQKKYREALAKGQKVITIGGIHGKIIEVGDTTVIIEVEGQNRLKVEKSAIASDSQDQISEAK
jgi:preprotein translocase subunit YajC